MEKRTSLVGVVALLCASSCVPFNLIVKKHGASSGGSSPSEAQSRFVERPAEQPASNHRAASASRQAPPPGVTPAAAGTPYTLKKPPSWVPELVYLPGATLDTPPSKLFGQGAYDMSCGSSTSTTPLLKLHLDTKQPTSFAIAASGDNVDGLLIVKSGKMYWDCPGSIGMAPLVHNMDWSPGDYDVYAVTRKTPSITTDVYLEFEDPATPADLSKTMTVSIGKPLARPLHFTVPLTSAPVRLYDNRQGLLCDRTPLPVAPDFVLDIKRPAASPVLVQPLSTSPDVTMRVQLITDDALGGKQCLRAGMVPNNPTGKPSYGARSQYFIPQGFEGKALVSLGTPRGERPRSVTFIAYDATTRLDPLFVHPTLPATLPPEQRMLAYAMPLLDYSEVTYGSVAGEKLTAEVFRTAPAQVFLYPTEDLDAQTASVKHPLRGARVVDDVFPRRNEPLLPLSYDREYVEVLAADGVRFRTKIKRLSPTPGGHPAPLARPRPLRAGMSVEDVSPMIPRDGKAILKAYQRKVDRHDACAQRVASKYDAAIDRQQWVVHSNAGDTVVETRKAGVLRGRAARAVEPGLRLDGRALQARPGHRRQAGPGGRQRPARVAQEGQQPVLSRAHAGARVTVPPHPRRTGPRPGPGPGSG